MTTDDLESALTGIWRRVFDHDRIGRDDDFFALGGHSLLAIRISAEVRGELGLAVPVRAVFDHPTVAALTAYLAGRPPSAGATA